jgi:asparagine N-glycosylation enzyme membrane subunit Stt3
VLAAYMLTWTSGAFLVAVIFVWLLVASWIDFVARPPTGRVATLVGLGAAIAWVLVSWLQPPALYRREMQLFALQAAAAAGVALELVRRAVIALRWNPRIVPVMAVTSALAGIIAVRSLEPALFDAVMTDLARFSASTERMQVLEARPLLLYDGAFALAPIWTLFRTGFPLGLVGLVALVVLFVRRPTSRLALVIVWGASMYLATLGQNRFGYYLVPIAAITTGWMAATIIEAGRNRGGWRAWSAVAVVAAGAFIPNLSLGAWSAVRPSGLSPEWTPAFDWLRTSTPEPFDDASYYTAVYRDTPLRLPDYAVMAWWDAGYWLAGIARRPPIANPTQAGANVAGAFFASTDEASAVSILERARGRYVVAEENLPFIAIDGRTLVGKFEGVVTWAGLPTSRYYQQLLVRNPSGLLEPRFVFTADYYRSMAFRLVVLGGAAADRATGPTVFSWAPRAMSDGAVIGEVVATRRFATIAEAEAFKRTLPNDNHTIAGTDPARPIVPVEALSRLEPVYRTPAPGVHGHGAVKVFELEAGANPRE